MSTQEAPRAAARALGPSLLSVNPLGAPALSRHIAGKGQVGSPARLLRFRLGS